MNSFYALLALVTLGIALLVIWRMRDRTRDMQHKTTESSLARNGPPEDR